MCVPLRRGSVAVCSSVAGVYLLSSTGRSGLELLSVSCVYPYAETLLQWCVVLQYISAY